MCKGDFYISEYKDRVLARKPHKSCALESCSNKLVDIPWDELFVKGTQAWKDSQEPNEQRDGLISLFCSEKCLTEEQQ